MAASTPATAPPATAFGRPDRSRACPSAPHRARGRTLVLALRLALGLVPALLAYGCNLFSSTCDETDATCLSRITGSGVDAPCERTIQCRIGLQCEAERCQAVGIAEEGESCSLTAECQPDLYCDHTRRCTPAGDGKVGAACTSTADCVAGLGCGLGPDLLSGTCQKRAEGDLGDSCAQAKDCAAGLHCLPLRDQSICQSLPATPAEVPPLPAWQGPTCDPEPSAPTAHFEVPAEGEDVLPDFYRLPFPNDFWLSGDDPRLDLSRHPRPPADSEFSTANRYLDAISGDADGFATTPVVVFRFSTKIGNSRNELEQAVRVVDITAANSASYGDQATVDVQTGEHSHYVCGEFLAVRVLPESPLLPGHTYAALVSRSVHSDSDEAFTPGSDLAKMFQTTKPSAAHLAKAHTAFAPLRNYLKEKGESADPWLAATVFTVGDPIAPMLQLRAALEDHVPTVVEGSVERCPSAGATEERPTADPCPAAPANVIILRGELRLPLFQIGTLPYDELGQGGIDWTADLSQVDSLNVRFGLSLPTSPPPTEGYPLLIYAHGTNGSFASPFDADGLGPAVAQSSARIATLAFDLPMHGTRRGGSDEEPARLFFNVTNPDAARGNVLQGAADLIAILDFATTGDFGELSAQLESTVSFDQDRIALMGHSQGATHAGLMLAHETRVRAFMLSGMGGHLSTSLLHKEKPLPISDLMGALLADMVTKTLIPEPGLAASAFNPMLAIMQTYFESADPLNFARLIHLAPPSGLSPESHLFMSYGLSDHYTPEPSQIAYAAAAQLPHVTPHLSALPLPTAVAPALESIETAGIGRTIGLKQYRPTGTADGHFIAVLNGQPGRSDVERFITVALSGSVPPIGN